MCMGQCAFGQCASPTHYAAATKQLLPTGCGLLAPPPASTSAPAVVAMRHGSGQRERRCVVTRGAANGSGQPGLTSFTGSAGSSGSAGFHAGTHVVDRMRHAGAHAPSTCPRTGAASLLHALLAPAFLCAQGRLAGQVRARLKGAAPCAFGRPACTTRQQRRRAITPGMQPPS